MKESYRQLIIPALLNSGIWSQISHHSRSVSSTSMFMTPCKHPIEVKVQVDERFLAEILYLTVIVYIFGESFVFLVGSKFIVIFLVRPKFLLYFWWVIHRA
jgi:hypothetical protein